MNAMPAARPATRAGAPPRNAAKPSPATPPPASRARSPLPRRAAHRRG